MSTKQHEEKLDKRAAALRDNLKKRKALKKEQVTKAKDEKQNED